MELLEDPDISHPFRDVVFPSCPPFCPESHTSADIRARHFIWERPKAQETETLSASFCFEHAQNMKKVVKAMEKENAILRRQLYKVNEENYHLVKQLKRFKGADFEKLKKETNFLKTRMDGLVRENLFLRAESRKGANSLLHSSRQVPPGVTLRCDSPKRT